MSRDNRDYLLGVRLLPKEREAVETLAARRGERISETVRAILLKAARSDQKRQEKRGELAVAS